MVGRASEDGVLLGNIWLGGAIGGRNCSGGRVVWGCRSWELSGRDLSWVVSAVGGAVVGGTSAGDRLGEA